MASNNNPNTVSTPTPPVSPPAISRSNAINSNDDYDNTNDRLSRASHTIEEDDNSQPFLNLTTSSDNMIQQKEHNQEHNDDMNETIALSNTDSNAGIYTTTLPASRLEEDVNVIMNATSSEFDASPEDITEHNPNSTLHSSNENVIVKQQKPEYQCTDNSVSQLEFPLLSSYSKPFFSSGEENILGMTAEFKMNENIRSSQQVFLQSISKEASNRSSIGSVSIAQNINSLNNDLTNSSNTSNSILGRQVSPDSFKQTSVLLDLTRRPRLMSAPAYHHVSQHQSVNDNEFIFSSENNFIEQLIASSSTAIHYQTNGDQFRTPSNDFTSAPHPEIVRERTSTTAMDIILHNIMRNQQQKTNNSLTETDMYNIQSLIQSTNTPVGPNHRSVSTTTSSSLENHENSSSLPIAVELNTVENDLTFSDYVPNPINSQQHPCLIQETSSFSRDSQPNPITQDSHPMIPTIVFPRNQPMFPSPPNTPMLMGNMSTRSSIHPQFSSATGNTSNTALSFDIHHVTQGNLPSTQMYQDINPPVLLHETGRILELQHDNHDNKVSPMRQSGVHPSMLGHSNRFNMVSSRDGNNKNYPKYIDGDSTIVQSPFNNSEAHQILNNFVQPMFSVNYNNHIPSQPKEKQDGFGDPIYMNMSNKDLNDMIQECMIMDPLRGRVFKCCKSFCSKAYKNPNGLKYHLKCGKCELETTSPSTNTNSVHSRTIHPNDIQEFSVMTGRKILTVKRPYWCFVPGCHRRYKNLNGLKYHARVAHPNLDFATDIRGQTEFEAQEQ